MHVKVDNINEQLGLMMKFIEGLQSQLGNEVDALAKYDQAALVKKFGGAKKIIESGGLSGTPVPNKN